MNVTAAMTLSVLLLAIGGCDSHSGDEAADRSPDSHTPSTTEIASSDDGAREDEGESADGMTLAPALPEVKSLLEEGGFAIIRGNPLNGLDNWIAKGDGSVAQWLARGDRIYEASTTLLIDLNDPQWTTVEDVVPFLDLLHPDLPDVVRKVRSASDFSQPWSVFDTLNGVLVHSQYRFMNEEFGAVVVTAKPLAGQANTSDE